MLDAGIHHMIVVDDGSVVGILDMADVCRGLLSVDNGTEQQISRETSKEVDSVPG
jgi:signal-transduction protein with cAMP-binding, CBS, and nucleotidyltransferase domain